MFNTLLLIHATSAVIVIREITSLCGSVPLEQLLESPGTSHHDHTTVKRGWIHPWYVTGSLPRPPVLRQPQSSYLQLRKGTPTVSCFSTRVQRAPRALRHFHGYHCVRCPKKFQGRISRHLSKRCPSFSNQSRCCIETSQHYYNSPAVSTDPDMRPLNRRDFGGSYLNELGVVSSVWVLVFMS